MKRSIQIGKETCEFTFISGSGEDSVLNAALQQLETLPGPVAIDTETTGLNPVVDQVRLVQVAVGDQAVVVDLGAYRMVPDEKPLAARGLPGLRALAALLEGDRPKVLQNAAFDLGFLAFEGVNIGGPLFDTMIAAKIVNNGTNAKNGLGEITERETGIEIPKELQKSDWSKELTDEMIEYSVRDALILLRLVTPLREKLRGAAVTKEVSLWDVFRLEMSALRGVASMQIHGFRFDLPRARKLHMELLAEVEEAKQAFLMELDAEIKRKHPDDPQKWLPRDEDGSFNTREKTSGSVRLGTKKYAGFNPRAPIQMAAAFEKAGIILPPNAKGKTSLDQNLLAFIRKQYPLVERYLGFKEVSTSVSALETLMEHVNEMTGRIHGSYRQVGTETGRLSAAKPNLQQVPRTEKFRSLFIAEEGYVLVVADFSQVELRVAAELSGEPRMIEAYRAGRDLHTETAALMTGVPFDQVSKSDRQSAKIANFGLLYGAGPATLRKQAVAQYGLDMSLNEAKEIVEGFRSAYPTLHKWQTREGNKTTPCVFTGYGRRRILVNFNDKFTTRINTQVQGTAGDIAKIAIAKLWEQLGEVPEDEARLIACCHDELVLEVRADVEDKWKQTLKRSMEEAGSVVCHEVPIVAEASSGSSWAEAK
jgi:DNA polymerase I-like protein with 3'-5' exonuclease and polymerase domains